MSGSRRTANVWSGIAIIATALMGQRIAAADQPVHDVQIVASRFTFEPSTIQVTAGESVRLVIRSKDGTPGFAIPKLKIDLRIPDEIACSEFCGRVHAQMKAALVSISVTKTNR